MTRTKRCVCGPFIQQVDVESEPGAVAYRQHPLLRSYARALLVQAGEMAEVFGCYADFITRVATQFDTLPAEQWDVNLGPYYPHIMFVGDTLVEDTQTGTRGDIGRAQAFSYTIRPYLSLHREVHRMAWIEMGLQTSRSLQASPDPEQVSFYKRREAMFLTDQGSGWSNLGERHKALEYLEQALLLSQALSDVISEAVVLNAIGMVWSALDEPRKALALHEQALVLRRANNSGEDASTLNYIAMVWSDLGEKRKALALYEQVLAEFQAMGDRHGEATAFNNLGSTWAALGEIHKALALFEQALPVFQVIDDRYGEATTLGNIGKAWAALGEKPKALALYEQALPLFQMVGDRSGEATALHNIGNVWSALGEKPKALEYLEQGLLVYQAADDRSGEATALYNIAKMCTDLGEKPKALALYERARAVFQALGDRQMLAYTLSDMSTIHERLYDIHQAIVCAEESVTLLTAIEDVDVENARKNLERLKSLRDGEVQYTGQGNIPSEEVQWLAQTTYSVKTGAPDRLEEWQSLLIEKNILFGLLKKKNPWSNELDFVDALLAILQDQAPVLPPKNPYADVVKQVIAAIRKYHPKTQQTKTPQKNIPLPSSGSDVKTPAASEVKPKKPKSKLRVYLRWTAMLLIGACACSLVSSLTTPTKPSQSAAALPTESQTQIASDRSTEEAVVQTVAAMATDPSMTQALVAVLFAILDEQSPTLIADNPYIDVVQQVIAAIQQYGE